MNYAHRYYFKMASYHADSQPDEVQSNPFLQSPVLNLRFTAVRKLETAPRFAFNFPKQYFVAARLLALPMPEPLSAN